MAKKIANALFGNNIVEYGGYQPTQPTDWDKVFDKGEKEIQGVLDARQEERDKNDEVFNTTEAALTDFTTGVSQDFGNYIGAGLEENRNLTMNMYKKLKNNEISSTQYRMFLNRQQQDWAEMGTFSKEYEGRLAELEKRKAGLVDPATGKVQQSSILEYEYFAKEIAQAANFGNKKLVPNASTGGLYSVTYDDAGKAVKSSVMSTQELNNFQKQKVDKVDLTNMIAGYTKRINDTDLKTVIFNNADAIKRAGGLSKYLAETDSRFAASYEAFINSVEDAVTKLPPNQVASALADNVSPGKMVNGEPVISNTGNWFVYSDKSELKGKDASLGVLMVKQQDGSMAAELTEDQREYLRANTRNIADTQLGYEEEFGVDYTKEKMDVDIEKTKIQSATDIKEAELRKQQATGVAAIKAQADVDVAEIKNADKPVATDTPYTNVVLTAIKDKSTKALTAANPEMIQSSSWSPNGQFVTINLRDDTSEKLDMTKEDDQIAYIKYYYPNEDDQQKILQQFKEDKGAYSAAELSTHVGTADESVTGDVFEFKGTTASGDPYSFSDFIRDDYEGNVTKHKFVSDYFTSIGVQTPLDATNFTPSLDQSGDNMIYTYTSPNGMKVKSDAIIADAAMYNEPGSTDAAGKAIQKTLTGLGNKIYQIENNTYVPKFEELQTNTQVNVQDLSDQEFNGDINKAIAFIVENDIIDDYKLY